MKAAGIVPSQPFSRPQTATNRLCGLCWARSGCYPIFCFAQHGAKQGASGFAVVQRLYCDFNAKRKPPDKRVAFSEGQ